MAPNLRPRSVRKQADRVVSSSAATDAGPLDPRGDASLFASTAAARQDSVDDVAWTYTKVK
jgi:hypothetical protein